MKRYRGLSLFTVLLAAGMIFGVTATAVAQSYTVNVTTAPDGMKYLTDSNGMTLYYFTKDTKGESVCSGGCSAIWPPFYAGTVSAPASVDPAAFGTITRNDGSQQTTFDGWPLYSFAGDKSPGDMKGQGFRNLWYVIPVPAYTVMIGTSSKLGDYLTTAKGMTLYYFSKDSTNTSACNGRCAQAWPPFYASHIVTPAGLNASDFGTMTRADGSSQTTFKGQPLYRWFRDKTRGETTGEGFANVWHVLNPATFHPGS